MNNRFTVVFKYGCFSGVIGEGMSVATTGSSGSLQAEVINIKMDINDDDELDNWIRETGETLYHPVGTCKMGIDELAVTNEHGQVHGIESLRVVDASLMPSLIAGNTNAPTIMIAEKISDHINGKSFLSKEN